jgi:hypothetical protein
MFWKFRSPTTMFQPMLFGESRIHMGIGSHIGRRTEGHIFIMELLPLRIWGQAESANIHLLKHTSTRNGNAREGKKQPGMRGVSKSEGSMST